MTQDAGDGASRQRTRWSEDRTIMANERTFSSWMGGGMGALGVALGLKAVFGAFEPIWVAKAAATVFTLIAVAMFQVARRNACRTLQRLTENDVEASTPQTFSVIAHALTFGALAIAAILWSL